MRERLFILGVFLTGLLIVFRLFYWQVLRQDKLLALAESQYLKIAEITASRGEILASDGQPLVTNEAAYTIFGLPKELKVQPEEIAKKLSPILANLDKEPVVGELQEEFEARNLERLKVTEKEIEERLSQKTLSWVLLARKVSHDKKDRIQSEKIEGVGARLEEKRLYPEASMAAHILGFVGSDSQGKDTGYFGLEGYYNGQLKGKSGVVSQEKDAAGNPILLGNFQEVEPRQGRALITSIDRTVQFIAEEKLKKGIEKYGAKGGSVIVADPKAGAILAMASFPSYDPASWEDYKEEDFKNPIVADTYEPGSTFKLIGMAAALNEKILKPETICENCAGPREISGFTIRTWNNKYQENQTATYTLVHSDNVGMVFVAEKLGLPRYLRYLSKFGFGEETGADLQDETPAKLRSSKDWKQIDLATASFGQGIAVTAIQMLQAVGAIANGGNLMQPYIVQKITGDGKTFDNHPKVVREVISEEAAGILKEMMVEAVEEGEARYFAPKGFKIAGKTGTAQIPIAGHYDPHKTIASFVGFAPADNPRFVMLVRYTAPTTSPYGAETAAPTFFEIAKELFAYFGIAPR